MTIDFCTEHYRGNATVVGGYVVAAYLRAVKSNRGSGILVSWDENDGYSANDGTDVDAVWRYARRYGRVRNA